MNNIEWSVDVPIFKHSLILKQLAIAIGIPFGLLFIFFFLISNPENRIYSFYAFGIILLLFLLTYLFIMLIYKGKYSVTFHMDDEGIRCITRADMAKKNRIVNGLTISLGLLAGKSSIAGAGILANSKQSVYLKWKQVKNVKYDPKHQSILLRSHPMESIGVFCTQENYSIVETYIKNKLAA